jgi:hypothetical protein
MKRVYYLTKKLKPPLNTWDRGQCCGYPTYYSENEALVKVAPNQYTTEDTDHSSIEISNNNKQVLYITYLMKKVVSDCP